MSPPWGGINYKNSDIYSIKESMTPDISEIIKVCLRISKYIMFYVPRTLMLEELFEIISKINGKKRLFFDIHIIKSANKIKVLLIIFGYDIDSKIGEKEIDEYLRYIYGPKLTDIYIKLLSAIAKIIGNYRFLENEINFRKSCEESEESEESEKSIENNNYNVGKELLDYFFKSVFTPQEKIRFKSLNVFAQFKSMNKNKSKKNNKNKNKNKENGKKDINNKNKDNKDNINISTDLSNINNDINNDKKEIDYINKYTIMYTGDNNENYLRLKESIKNDEDEKSNDNDLKFSPMPTKKYILGEISEPDEKINLSNSPSPTISTSPSSSMLISNNKNCIMSLPYKDKLLQEELTFTSCHEINLNYIPK